MPRPFIFGFNLVDRVAPAMAAQPTETPFHPAPQRTTCGTGQRQRKKLGCTAGIPPVLQRVMGRLCHEVVLEGL